MVTKSGKTKPTPAAKPVPREGLARIPEAAKFLAVSRFSIYRMIKEGQLKAVTVRDAHRVPWPELHAIAESYKSG